ncbi:MAG: rhomboid family intramembrane serine protease [Polyangiaceae bacterium]
MSEFKRLPFAGSPFVSILPAATGSLSFTGNTPDGGSAPLQLFPTTPQAEPPPDPFAGLTAIGPTTERKAREWSLVLQSSETWHTTRWTPNGYILLVRDADYESAATSIDRYEAENRDFPPRRTKEQARFAPSMAAPFIFLALAAFFVVTGPVFKYSAFFQRGTAVTSLVLSSEPWRAVTALTLHADTAHLLGNAISGTVFASAVHRRLGPGGGSLAILASGIAGNVANAFYHQALGQTDHRSIGASTAIFGAIGLLAATQLFLNRRKDSGERGFLAWAGPVIGGLALLGTLGAGGAMTDLGAHLFGLAGGAVIGIGAGLLLRDKLGTRQKPSRRAWWQEIALGATAMGVVVGSWLLSFYRLHI